VGVESSPGVRGALVKFRRGSSDADASAKLPKAELDSTESRPEAGGITSSVGAAAGDSAVVPEPATHISLFGARSQARSLAAQVTQLQEQVDRLGLLSVIELEQRKEQLKSELNELEAKLAAERNEAVAQIEREQAAARQRGEAAVSTLRIEESELGGRVSELRGEVVVTEDTAILQEVGIYEYRHPLTDAVAYQAELKRLQDQIKVMARKDGGAVLAATDWTVNGSRAQGRAMVREYSKLVLRAYNAEADNLVRALKPYKLGSALDRLGKIAIAIERLGKTMNIRISPAYHALRIRELELTADYLEKRAEEKEREAADRERLREERRVQQELARERARLEKEHQHYSNVIQRLIEQGKHDAAEEHQATLAQIVKAIEDVDYRVANVRAGYVYVISNIGAFGEKMVKIGLTRRIDPTERVRELGDASVPFRYDTHALFFSDDAVGLEAKMHQRLAGRRVNWVNKRREFFYVSPAEAKHHLVELAGELLEYVDEPEALEFRQSMNQARNTDATMPNDPPDGDSEPQPIESGTPVHSGPPIADPTAAP
jgi:seryl-tRNA synthetase